MHAMDKEFTKNLRLGNRNANSNKNRGKRKINKVISLNNENTKYN
jgi:hypothetical protein